MITKNCNFRCRFHFEGKNDGWITASAILCVKEKGSKIAYFWGNVVYGKPQRQIVGATKVWCCELYEHFFKNLPMHTLCGRFESGLRFGFSEKEILSFPQIFLSRERLSNFAKLQFQDDKIDQNTNFLHHFSVVYNQERLILQTIYVLNKEMWA